MNNLHVCHDAVLSWEQQIKAATLAIKEKAANAFTNPNVITDAAAGGFDMDPLSAVLLRDKKWQVGTVISIAFLDGSSTMQRLVREKANELLQYINLKFLWVSDPNQADVRITFNRGGSWSYLGTDNLAISKPKPTMQFGWLTESSNAQELNRVVHHEFLHMLGLGHEQAHPTGGIPWDKPKVYDYYRRTNGWDARTVDSQVFYVYSQSMTNFSAYDKYSIMLYAIPAELLTDPTRAVGWNSDLSGTDKAFLMEQYAGSVTKPERPWEKNGWYEGRARRQLTYWPPSNEFGSGDHKRYGMEEFSPADVEYEAVK